MRITELANDISLDLDQSSPERFLRILRAVDSQLFTSFRGHTALLDEETAIVLSQAARAAEAVLSSGGRVIMMGCGTSGRMCHLVATLYCKEFNVVGRIAGGMASLVMSNELPEDDPSAGEEDFVRALGDHRKALLVGVSCGLSADYVAGALRRALADNHSVVCMGFNESSEARTTLFKNVIRSIVESSRDDQLLLNPIIGPEAVAGSSRMKGGTAALLMLDSLFHAVLQKKLKPSDLLARLAYHRKLVQRVYTVENRAALLPCFAPISHVLSPPARGKVVIVAESQTTALSAVFPCTEMTDTYGFERVRIRAILADAESGVADALGLDVTQWNAIVNESTDAEVRELGLESVMGAVCSDDLVISLCDRGKAAQRGTLLVKQSGARHAVICIGDMMHDSMRNTRCAVPLFAKLVLDALTTYGGVCAKFVLSNRMINLTVANAKLRQRAIQLISTLKEVSLVDARHALRRAIFSTDTLEPDCSAAGSESDEVVEHEVIAATTAAMVVPTAMILAQHPARTVAEARAILNAEFQSADAVVENDRNASADETDSDVRLFGIVEGAYGPLFSDSDRFRLIDLMCYANRAAQQWAGEQADQQGTRRLNCYLYGPKDDSATRVTWRTVLPDSDVRRIRKLVDRCSANAVKFVVALHIGCDVKFELSESDERFLRARVRQLREQCGVHGVAVFFDDVDLDDVVPRDGGAEGASAAAWHSAALAQAAACSAVLSEWREGGNDCRDRGEFLLCPSCYHVRDARPNTEVYLRELGVHVPAKFDILWTGNEIISRSILRADILKVNKLLGRRVLLWDNVTTNDYDVTRCFLAPVALRAPSLFLNSLTDDSHQSPPGVIRGLLLNNPVSASLFDVPLLSLARLVCAPLLYSPHKALPELVDLWRNDRRGAFGLSQDDALLLVDLCKSPFDDGLVVKTVSSRIDRLLKRGEGDAAKVISALDSIAQLYERVVELPNRGLVEALHSVLWPIKEEALLLGRLLRRDKDSWYSPCADETVDEYDAVWRGGSYRRLARHVQRVPSGSATVCLLASDALSLSSVPDMRQRAAVQQGRFIIEQFDTSKHKLAEVRQVCVATGDEGEDGVAILDDDVSCYPDVFVAPYLDAAVVPPGEQLALVVVDRSKGNQVAGYCLGVRNSQAFFAQCRTVYFPRVAPSKTSPYAQLAATTSETELRHLTPAERVRLALYRDVAGLEKIDELQSAFYDNYPAHLHIDLKSEAQGHGLGRTMLESMLSSLRETPDGTKVSGMHLVCAQSNARARRIYESLGLKVLKIENGNCCMGRTL